MKTAEVISLVRSGKFAVISYDPNNLPLRNGKPHTIFQYADDAWWNWAYAAGKWNDCFDQSIFVANIDGVAAKICGVEYKQDAVVADDAVLYTDGTTEPDILDCANTLFCTDFPPHGNYTAVKCSDGYVYFQVPELDLSSLTVTERVALYRKHHLDTRGKPIR